MGHNGCSIPPSKSNSKCEDCSSFNPNSFVAAFCNTGAFSELVQILKSDQNSQIYSTQQSLGSRSTCVVWYFSSLVTQNSKRYISQCGQCTDATDGYNGKSRAQAFQTLFRFYNPTETAKHTALNSNQAAEVPVWSGTFPLLFHISRK